MHAINQYLFIKNSIAPGPNSKALGKNTVLRSTGNYVCNILKKAKNLIKVGHNGKDLSTKKSVSPGPNSKGGGMKR